VPFAPLRLRRAKARTLLFRRRRSLELRLRNRLKTILELLALKKVYERNFREIRCNESASLVPRDSALLFAEGELCALKKSSKDDTRYKAHLSGAERLGARHFLDIRNRLKTRLEMKAQLSRYRETREFAEGDARDAKGLPSLVLAPSLSAHEIRRYKSRLSVAFIARESAFGEGSLSVTQAFAEGGSHLCAPNLSPRDRLCTFFAEGDREIRRSLEKEFAFGEREEKRRVPLAEGEHRPPSAKR